VTPSWLGRALSRHTRARQIPRVGLEVQIGGIGAGIEGEKEYGDEQKYIEEHYDPPSAVSGRTAMVITWQNRQRQSSIRMREVVLWNLTIHTLLEFYDTEYPHCICDKK
jgi:hypothetical protein